MNTASVFRVMALMLIALGLSSCELQNNPVTPENHSLAIGGLFSTTGNWNTLGMAGNAAAELAVEDVNLYFAKIGSKTRLTYKNTDTKLDPAMALDGLAGHYAEGTRIVVGPQSSAEVSAMKAYADSNGVAVISPSSTAGSLAISNDNILRMCPADIAEGPAIASMMLTEGCGHMITLWREDIGNVGLKDATSTAMLARGGTVTVGVSYAPDVTDFTATLAALRVKVSAEVSARGANAVCVYYPGFDEVAQLFAAIPAADSILRGVRWYGGDGTAMSTALLPHEPFITKSGYPNPLFGIGDGAAVAGPVAARIKARSGFDADAYSLSVYDAIWIAAKAFDAAKASISSPATFRENFITEASTYFGTTGWTKLNLAGDRAFGNFDMMAVRQVGGSAKWVRVGTYSASSDTYKPE